LATRRLASGDGEWPGGGLSTEEHQNCVQSRKSVAYHALPQGKGAMRRETGEKSVES
jgi:hypothetical protein